MSCTRPSLVGSDARPWLILRINTDQKLMLRKLSQCVLFGFWMLVSPLAISQGFVKCQDADGNWLYLDHYSNRCETNIEGMDEQGQQVWESKTPPTIADSIEKKVNQPEVEKQPSVEDDSEERVTAVDEIVGCWSLEREDRTFEYTYQMLRNGDFVGHLVTGEERGTWRRQRNGRYVLVPGSEGEYFQIEDGKLLSYDSAGFIRSFVKRDCYSAANNKRRRRTAGPRSKTSTRYAGCDADDEYYWDENGVIKDCDYVKDERNAGYWPCIERHRDWTGNISPADVERCLEMHVR